MLTENEKKIIAAIQRDIPVEQRPYLSIANKIGITEDEVIKTLQELCDKGMIRRFGATIRHQRSGFHANAMVAWVVSEEMVDETGSRFKGFQEVSHCYHRNPADGWPYNMYTMVHAKDADSIKAIVQKMSETTGVEKFSVLVSKREFKKTSMNYFPGE